MNPIRLLGFNGAALGPNVRLLAENVGAYVVDAEPGGGELKPLRDRLTVASVPTGQKTIYRMGRDTPNDALYWLSWPTAVSVTRGMDPDDTTERVLFTGSGTPKWTNNIIGLAGGAPYPQGSRELGMPAPLSAPVVSIITNGPTTGTQGTVFYVSTFVNDEGWESAPSPPSAGLVCYPGATVAIGSLEAAPAGSYGINRRRIYRTQPGATDGAASFYFLREVTIGTTSTTDDARALGELLATTGWIPLPAGAKAIIGLWNGMYAFLSGKTVGFTEPEKPYAAPVAYGHSIGDTPVATAKWEQNLLVLTTGRSVMFQGQDPASMSEIGAYAGQPCIAATSVVQFPFGVVWASNEGLAFSDAREVVTLGIFLPEQWRALRPQTFIAGRYGRHYVASYDDGAGKKGLMFDPLRPQDGVWFLSTGFDACFYDELADALFVLEGTSIRKFDAATARLTASFKSKVFHQVNARNFGHAKVVADRYPRSAPFVTMKVYAEYTDPLTGVSSMQLRATRNVLSPDPFTLPGGYLSQDWQLEVSGAAPIQAVHLATDIRDFKGG